MSQARTIPDRKQVVNQSLSQIVEFYKIPLIRSIDILRRQGYSLRRISEEVFNGEISKQAVFINYTRRGKGETK